MIIRVMLQMLIRVDVVILKEIEKLLHWIDRSPATHYMSPWVKKMFTQMLPRVLLMRRPIYFCQGSCGRERKKKNFFNGIDYRCFLDCEFSIEKEFFLESTIM